jgi:tripartite-type tricarboxylate transporter receptor subunit TctC
VVAAGATLAQSVDNYPARSVRAIVPFGTGGATDFVARIVAPKLSQELGQQIVIDNRAGAAGNIGVELAAGAAPDGYTILFGNVGSMAINPSVFPRFPIRPLRDFIGVSILSDVTIGIAIHPSVPAKTLKELFALAKARPGQLNFSSTGPSSAARLALEFILGKAGVKVAHIPYKGGGGDATLAVVRGEVEMSMQALSSFIPLAKAGRVRMLGVVASERSPQLPDVPTLAESGFPELTLGSWHGLYVQAGTPRPIVNKLHTAVLKVMKDPELGERYRRAGAVVTFSKSPEDFAAFMRSQTDFWARLVNELGAVEQ